MKTLFNLSYLAKDGLRTLVGPAQGRCMKATREEADRYLRDLLSANTPERLVSVFGDQSVGTFRVDAFECYDHGDPVGIYVEDDHA